MGNSYWSTADIPDQAGRVAVVTGANTGLGFETAKALGGAHARLVLAVRNLDKGKEAAASISATTPGADISLQQLDLSSLGSVREAATALRETHEHIDLLINNAGIMYTPKGTTTDGFELQFGTNHLGHFALTGLLLDRLLATPGSRVVTLSSVGHRIRAAIHFDDLQWQRTYSRIGAYGQSKLANLLFTYELQRRLAAAQASTIALAAHPGTANTELARNSPRPLRAMGDLFGRFIAQRPAMGALPTLRAATDPGAIGGQYYGPGGFRETRGWPTLVKSSKQSHDVELQRRLWAVSEELTGVTYPI
jgi:NAD(P)-dependent dehydrogenase (short-subunit alcohol dehydrogenase family)